MDSTGKRLHVALGVLFHLTGSKRNNVIYIHIITYMTPLHTTCTVVAHLSQLFIPHCSTLHSPLSTLHPYSPSHCIVYSLLLLYSFTLHPPLSTLHSYSPSHCILYSPPLLSFTLHSLLSTPTLLHIAFSTLHTYSPLSPW